MHGKLADVQRCVGDDVEPDPAEARAADTDYAVLLFCTQRAEREKPHDNDRRSLGGKRFAPKKARDL